MARKTPEYKPRKEEKTFYNNPVLSGISSILGYITKYPRDLGEIMTQTGLASKVKRAEVPSYTTEQLRAMGSSKNFYTQPEVQKYKAKSKKSQQAFGKLQSEISNPTYISSKEQENLYDYSNALKDTATVGSMIMPGIGSGFGGALATGAVSGGLGGFGSSEKGEELGSTLKGAAIGGAISGLGYGVGKAIQGIGKKIDKGISNKILKAESAADDTLTKMSKIERNGLAEQARGSGLWVDGKTTNWNVKRFQTARELTGLKNGTAQQVIDKLGETADNFHLIKDKGLSSMSLAPNSVDDITKSLSDRLLKESQANELLASNEFINTIDDIKRASQEGAVGLDDLATTMRNNVNYRMRGGNLVPISNAEQKVLDNAADSIVEYLKGISNSSDGLYTQGKTGLAEALQLMNTKELTVAEKAMNKGLSMYGMQAPGNVLPFNKISGGISRAVGRGKEIAGKGIGNIGNLGTSIAQKIGTGGGEKISSTLGSLGGMFGDVSQSLAGIGGGLGSAAVGEQSMGQETSQQISPIGDSQSAGSFDTSGIMINPETGYLQLPPTQGLGGLGGGSYTFQDAVAEAYQAFPNATESTILATAKYLMEQKSTSGMGGEGGGLSQTVSDAISMIDEFGGGVAGKVSTAGQKIGEFFGGSYKGTEYRAMISEIRTQLIHEIAGTAQTKAEMKNLTDKLPKATDEPAVAKAKLQLLLKNLGSKSASSSSLSDEYTSFEQ
jgi:hypothetical protein